VVKQEWLQVRMTSEEKEELQALADEMDMKMSEIVRQAIEYFKFQYTVMKDFNPAKKT